MSWGAGKFMISVKLYLPKLSLSYSKKKKNSNITNFYAFYIPNASFPAATFNYKATLDSVLGTHR